MYILENEPLKNHTTMRIGGPARYFIDVKTKEEIIEAYNFSKKNNLPIEVIGGGSNIIFTDAGYRGVVLKNNIQGLNFKRENLITAFAGEKWDNVVEQCVNVNLGGIEALSWIPGTVGGAPVNNIGAYGQEIKDTLAEVEALDTLSGKLVVLNNEQCKFTYRDSIFKSSKRHQYIIISITLALKKISSAQEYKPPIYKSLEQELINLNIKNPKIKDVRTAVVKLRKSKLPDPEKIPNTGSFFKNPIVSNQKYNFLLKKFPDMPAFTFDKTSKKLYAGWLLDKVGLKNYSHKGICLYKKQALVLTNPKQGTYKDLETTYKHIQKNIYDNFDIHLEIEPEIIK